MKLLFPALYTHIPANSTMSVLQPSPRFTGRESDTYMPSSDDSGESSDDIPLSQLSNRGKRTVPIPRRVELGEPLPKRPRLPERVIDSGNLSPFVSPALSGHSNLDFEVMALDENTTQIVCSSPVAEDANGIQNIVIRHINGPSLSDRSRFPLRDWRYPVHVMDEFADDRNPTICHPLVRQRIDEASFTLSEDSKAIVREFYKPRRNAEQAIAELEKNTTQLLRRKIMGLPNEHIGYYTRLIKRSDVPGTELHKVGTWGLFAQDEPGIPLPTVQSCRILDFYDGTLLLNNQQRAYHEKSYGSKYINYSLEVGTDQLMPHIPVAAYGGGNEMQFANMSVVAHRDETKPYGYRLEPHRRKTNADYLTGTITLPNKFGQMVSYPVGALIGRPNLKPGQEICPPYGPDFMPELEELYFGPQAGQEAEPYIKRERSASPPASVSALQGLAIAAERLLSPDVSSGFIPINQLPRHIMAAHALLDRLDTTPEIRQALKTIVQWPEVDQKSLTSLLALYEERLPGTKIPGRNTVAKLVGEYNRLRSGLMPHIGLLPGRKEIDTPTEHKAAFMRYYNAQPSGQTVGDFRRGFEAASGIQLSRFVVQNLINSAPINKLSMAKAPPKAGDHHPDHGKFSTFVHNNRYYDHFLKGWLSIGQFHRWFMKDNPKSTFTARMADFARVKLLKEAGQDPEPDSVLSGNATGGLAEVADKTDSASELSDPPSDWESYNPFANSVQNMTESSALQLEKDKFSKWAKENSELDFPYLVWKKMHPNTLISRSWGAKLVRNLKEPDPKKPKSRAELNAIRFVDTVTDSSNDFWKARLGTATLKTLKTLYNEQNPQYKVSLNTSTDLEVNKAIRQNNADPRKPHIGSGAIAGNKTDRALQERVFDYILGQGKGKSLKTLESDLAANGMHISKNTFQNWIAQTSDGGWMLKTRQLQSEFPALMQKYGFTQTEEEFALATKKGSKSLSC